MSRFGKVVLAVLAGVFVLLGAPVASAAPSQATQSPVQVVTGQRVFEETTKPPAPGPSINQKSKDATAAANRNKLILGGFVVVLLVVVYFGRRSKLKYKRKKKNLQNAKG